ncbi:MAG: OmpA family protein [Acetobacteraceae bacterium]
MRRVVALLLLITATVSVARAEEPARKYIVYFQEWSAAVDGPAEGIIKEVASMAQTRSGTLRIVGFADPTGSRKANILLSELRAQRVVDLLADAGVAPSRLVLSGKGAVEFAISSQEARRVEISFHHR